MASDRRDWNRRPIESISNAYDARVGPRRSRDLSPDVGSYGSRSDAERNNAAMTRVRHGIIHMSKRIVEADNVPPM